MTSFCYFKGSLLPACFPDRGGFALLCQWSMCRAHCSHAVHSSMEATWRFSGMKRRRQFPLPTPLCTGSLNPSHKNLWSPKTTTAGCMQGAEEQSPSSEAGMNHTAITKGLICCICVPTEQQFAFFTFFGSSTVSYFFLIILSQNAILQQREQLYKLKQISMAVKACTRKKSK